MSDAQLDGQGIPATAISEKQAGPSAVQQAFREKILGFQELLAQVPGAKLGDSDLCPLKHTFADGMYVREIFIPKGTVIVGKIHRHAHPNFLMSGEVTVVTEDGGRQRIRGPMSMISKAGTKRVVYAHEDSVWITVHVTRETDLEKIEDEIIAKTYDELEAVPELSQLGQGLEPDLGPRQEETP